MLRDEAATWSWPRYLAAVVFLILAIAPAYAAAWDADFLRPHGDAAIVLYVGLLYGRMGFVIARWWVLILVPLPVLLTPPLGSHYNFGDISYSGWVLVLTSLIGAPAALIGLGLRPCIGVLRERHVASQ